MGGRRHMRLTAIGALVGSLIAAGCDGTGAPRTSGNALAAPGAQGEDARGHDSNAPAGAAGTSSAAPGSHAPNAAQAEWREVTIPQGTTLSVVLEDSIGSDTSHVEQPVHAHVSHPVAVNGVTAIPPGSTVAGVVTEVTRAAKVKGRARVAFRFDSLTASGNDERYKIHTAAVDRMAPATKQKDAVKILAPAAAGALIGGIAGGRKAAVIGTAAGAGAGTAVVMS